MTNAPAQKETTSSVANSKNIANTWKKCGKSTTSETGKANSQT
jgi:hypothetical protein